MTYLNRGKGVVIIDDRFVREQERVYQRELERAVKAGDDNPDSRRLERRAYAETIDRALARGGRI